MNTPEDLRIRPQPPRVHPVTRWHRLVGIASTAVVLLTITTGLILNHSDAWDLSKRRARSAAVYYLYGHSNPPLSSSYRIGRGWITQIGSRVFLDGAEILQHQALFVGAVEIENAILIAFEDGMVELDEGLNVVERYGVLDGLKPPVKQIGSNGDDAFVEAAAGVMRFDTAAAAFVANDGSVPRWQAASPLPDSISRELVSNYRGPGVSYEQLLLDLHSGRLFGAAGVVIVDAAAVCMLVLAVSGIYLWFKFKRNNLPPPPKELPSNRP